MKILLHSTLLGLAAAATLGTAVPASAGTHVDVGVALGIPLPRGAVEINVGSERYYSHRGMYYRHGPHGYYVTRPPRGAVIRELPPRYTRIYVGGSVYYRYGDIYYESCPDGYVVVEPPRTVVRVPPPEKAPEADYQSVWVGETEYLFRDGQFFRKTPEGLVWVQAPMGAITKNLPADARSVWYEEIEYFESDDVYFRKTPDGYKVVPVPWKK